MLLNGRPSLSQPPRTGQLQVEWGNSGDVTLDLSDCHRFPVFDRANHRGFEHRADEGGDADCYRVQSCERITCLRAQFTM